MLVKPSLAAYTTRLPVNGGILEEQAPGQQHTQPRGCDLHRRHKLRSGTRNLLDLFQVGIDPLNGLVVIVYVDDMLTKDSSGKPLH